MLEWCIIMAMSRTLDLALQILAQPEVSRDAMRAEVKTYLSLLSPAQLKKLQDEALEGSDGEEWARKIEVLEELGFVDKEVEAYSKCRFTTPGIRKVIARRALLCKMTRLSPKAIRAKPYKEVCRLEDKLIGDMSTEEMIRRLKL